MNLRKKILIAITSTGLAFLLLSSIESIRLSFVSFAALTILAFLLILYIVYKTTIKRIEKLKEQVNDRIKNNLLAKYIVINGKDEISIISAAFNHLLDIIQSDQTFYHRVEEDSLQIQKENRDLKQTLAEHKIIGKDKNNRDCLSRIAGYDVLTSLPNRVFFNEILNKTISHLKRRNKNLAILLIDIDGFKKIHEELGQENSNFIIKEIGKRLASILRSEDIISKLDGDEFIVLLNDIAKPKFASTVALKLIKACREPINIHSKTLQLTVCIGISIFPYDGNSLEDLLKNANNALFKAKHLGKGSYQFYTHEMSVEAREYIQLESALRKALHSNELTLYYQPKFRIKTGNITGVEALMRWEHPVLGIINPSKFIPHAEDTGFILQIGEWALQKVCQEAKYWQDEGYEHITIAIKLSAKQFYHPDIATIIKKIVAQTKLNPKYLELEINEETVMSNVNETIEILNKIKETGVSIAIDHFGIGHTSINYLKKFPISTVKIDQSFIKGIPDQPNDTAIVSAVISLAHHLGLEVVAEGVETAEQVQFLTTQQCDIMQGYFLGNPSPGAKVILQLTKLRDEVYL